MKNILFVCTGNTCRSPVAEKVFNFMAKEKNLPFTAKSAGICTVTGLPMSENSALVLKEQGIDPVPFKSTSIDEVDLSRIDCFVALNEDHKYALVNDFCVDSDKIVVLNVDDPYGGSIAVYRVCFDEIRTAVRELINKLGEQDESSKTHN